MSSFPRLNLDPVMLAARVAKAYSFRHNLAFAQLAPDLTVVQQSPNFSALTESGDWFNTGAPIVDLLAEFVGAEELLQDILNGKLPYYQLDHVNREQPDGSIIYLNFQVTPLDELETGRGLLLLVEDATDYGRLHQALIQERNDLLLLQIQLARANEELQSLNHLKTLFLSMAAHDLRGPLTVTMAYTDLIRQKLRKGSDLDLERYLSVVTAQSQRLNRLISDLLDLDAIERNGLTLKLEPCDLSEIVRDIVDVFQISMQERQLTHKMNLPYQPVMVTLDRDKISRVVYNLISNAIKYTEPGGHIDVTLFFEDGEAVILVADNGPGMSQEQVANLFQIYYRTDEARKSKVEGTGLGLYIVRMLVEAHHGAVEVESTPGKGSTFIVHLPLDTE